MTPRTRQISSKNFAKSFEGFCLMGQTLVKTTLIPTRNPLKSLTPKFRPAWTNP
jgi:hypothetical protein